MRRNSLRVQPGRKETSASALKPLCTLSNAEGSVVATQAAVGVLYVRHDGGLSHSLGSEYAQFLERFVTRVPSIQYFADVSRLKSYDLLARSAFVRVVLANRRKFTSLVMLTWAQGVTGIAHTFAELLGDATVLSDRSEFTRLLLRAAPRADLVMNEAGVMSR